MKEITFTDSLSEVQEKAEKWKAANPHVKVIDSSKPSGSGHAKAGQDMFNDPNWSMTVKYEDRSSN
jgi:hypothetical protein